MAIINAHTGKHKHTGSIIPNIIVKGLKMYDPKSIANNFRKFYSELSENLASTIRPGETSVNTYISKIPRKLNSTVIKPTNQKKMEDFITSLPNKESSGHDNVSNVLLKELNESISYPLGLIFNQSVQDDVSLHTMKIAEISLLCKGKEQDIIVNF